MSYSEKDYEELVVRFETLRNDFEEYKQKHPSSGNGTVPHTGGAADTGAAVSESAGVIPESEKELQDTLARLGQRIAMIIQAEKCLLMLFDPESGELFGINPAFNIPPEDVAHVRIRVNQGISGEVFASGQPMIVHDAMRDPRAEHDHVGLLNARNMVSVPLIVEKRNAETGALIEKDNIGVLHVYNKRFGNEFTTEDITLLRRLAGNTASIIHSARLIDHLKDRNKELVETIESIQAGILVVSRNGQIRLVNRASRALFDLPDDCTHRSYADVIKNEKVCSLIERSFATRVEQSDEVVVGNESGEQSSDDTATNPDEKIFQAQTGLEYEENELVGVVAIFTDITQIRNVDRMKTAFVSTVSHELRTPLTMIKGFITTLLNAQEGDEEFTDEQVNEFYEIIDTECDRLTRLITDLLNVSRIEQGVDLELNLEPVDVKSIITKVVTSQQATDRTAEGRTPHDWNVEVDDTPPIIADGDRVEQIVTNLIDNASKYSPNGGTITIRLRDDGDSILVSIADQGMGMKKEFIDRGLFKKFSRESYTDHQKIYGTGLGLYLVKHMVEAHEGRIWAYSEYGHGATFFFRLPRKPPEH